MKKFFYLLLALGLTISVFSACDRRSEAPTAEVEEANFAPEATAVSGLTKALEEQGEPSPAPSAVEPQPVATEQSAPEEQPIAADAVRGQDSATPESSMPFATPSPQPNASVSEFTEISAPGLGFRFSYPTGWMNIPGRSTVCYVQPTEDGTVYPARVTVSMKRMPHSVDSDEVRSELASFIRTLMTQYDESTFKVDTNLDEETKFMGNHAISTTYLAYDGDQEIKGYTIITHFERYVFVYHFLCAYEDYEAFDATMRRMRDSVQADPDAAPR